MQPLGIVITSDLYQFFYNSKLNMSYTSLEDYIKQRLDTQESLPFDTTICNYSKNSEILSIGQHEKYICFLISGIVEVGRVVDNKETIFDFKYPGRFICVFSSFYHQQPSDTYVSCVTDCVVQKIPLAEFSKSLKTSLITNQLSSHILALAYLEVVKKEKLSSTKTPKERYVDLILQNSKVIQDIPDFKIAKYLGVHPTSLSRLKKAALLCVR